MNKSEYLEDPEVTAFIEWLGKTQDAQLYAKCFKGYQWGRAKNRKDYWENQKELDAHSRELKNAVKENNNEKVRNVCAKILHWGGMYRKYPKVRETELFNILKMRKPVLPSPK